MLQDEVILGVDTHLDMHVGAVVSSTGQLLGTQAVETSAAGYLQLLRWAQSMGHLLRAGVEGTATYGSGLTELLLNQGVEVFEVNRPDRASRRMRGKTDTADAESAARSVLTGRATAMPKHQSGITFALRAVSVARRSAVKARTQAINQLRGILVSAPQHVREKLLHTKAEDCVIKCSRIRALGSTPLLQSLTATLRLLADRWLALKAEIKILDAELERLTGIHAPRLRAKFGVGAHTAAVLICVAGDNPDRLKSEAALAALCGVSPLQASSGKTIRHRLNRGGDRSANNALWTIAMVRMRSDPRTREYVARRTAQGMSI